MVLYHLFFVGSLAEVNTVLFEVYVSYLALFLTNIFLIQELCMGLMRLLGIRYGLNLFLSFKRDGTLI